jgi:manganese-dependent inorganic pyrophosphatase
VHSEDSEKIEELYLRVGAMDIHSFGKHHNVAGIAADQSVIIVGDRLDIQERCIELGVRLLVITGELKVSESIIQAAKTKGISLIISPYDSATTSWIIRTATHIERLIDTRVHSFAKTDCVSSVKRRIANLNDSLYTVIDNEKRLVGVFSKSDILRPSKKRIALVDHNELEQAVSGAAEVHITEIIDHHRLGNIPTEQPILFINQPVGSTCSIVAELFRAKSITPSKSIAGIMMAGIISDTLLLNSPTTTPLEGELLKWLEPIAEIESSELADLIFTAGSLIVNNTPQKVIHADCKIYDEGVLRYSVSQVEELGFANFWNKETALKKALDSYNKKEGLLFSLLMISDINTQNSLLIFSGDGDIRQGIKFTERGKTGIFELPGVVSRKKQLIPYFSSLLKEQGLL